MKKTFFTFGAVALLLSIFSNSVYAKRVLPQVAQYKQAVARTQGVATSVKFRGDRLAIVVNFANIAIAKSVSYSLSYNSRGTVQGVTGTIPGDESDPQTRELLFGTCSHGVCRYDTDITNARFTVTTTLKNGLRIIRSFRLKV